jgi:hypothetical protein
MGNSKASVLQPCARKGSEAREAGLFVCDERSSYSGRTYTIESTSVLFRFGAGNGDGSQGGSSSRNDAGGWTFDLFETRRASPKQRTREGVTTGCSRLVEWGLWRSQWESNLDSVNLGQSHSSVTRRNALLAASEQTGNGPEATCPGTSRNTREVSAQSQGGAHASWLCCRSRSTTLRTTILRLRSGNVGRASPEAGDRAGRRDVGRRIAVAKSRDRRRPETIASKG